MTIKQYQQIQKLDESDIKAILEVLGYDFNTIIYADYEKLYEGIKEQNYTPEEIKTDYIKIKDRKFYIVKDFKRVKFKDWVKYDTIINNTSDEEVFERLHEIISILVNEKTLFRKKLNEKEKELFIQENMRIKDALSLAFFFFNCVQNYTKNIRMMSLMEATKS